MKRWKNYIKENKELNIEKLRTTMGLSGVWDSSTAKKNVCQIIWNILGIMRCCENNIVKTIHAEVEYPDEWILNVDDDS